MPAPESAMPAPEPAPESTVGAGFMPAPESAELRCLRCFTPMPGPEHGDCLGECPACGYDERNHKHHPIYLPPRACVGEHYLIGKTLGQGGFGITYLGLDTRLQKRVAIKEYLPTMLASRDMATGQVVPLKNQQEAYQKGLRLYLDEARNLARFDHPNIVRVLNYFPANHTAYMVMEYIAGQSLAELPRQGGLAEHEALAVLWPLLDALHTMHAQQVFHLDISAHNVLIQPNRQPVLIDFGAARRVVGDCSHSISLVLKPGYSPLEQYAGMEGIGPWTDIYACGALFYFLLTNALPPPAIQRLDNPRLTLPAELSPPVAKALRKALAVKARDRFPCVSALQQALQPSARHRHNWTLAVALAVVVAIYTGWRQTLAPTVPIVTPEFRVAPSNLSAETPLHPSSGPDAPATIGADASVELAESAPPAPPMEPAPDFAATAKATLFPRNARVPGDVRVPVPNRESNTANVTANLTPSSPPPATAELVPRPETQALPGTQAFANAPTSVPPVHLFTPQLLLAPPPVTAQNSGAPQPPPATAGLPPSRVRQEDSPPKDAPPLLTPSF